MAGTEAAIWHVGQKVPNPVPGNPLYPGATFLRDLAYTAWIESAKDDPPLKDTDVPNNPLNPRYNPATGSAPAPTPVKKP